jgi:hypothetical protein
MRLLPESEKFSAVVPIRDAPPPQRPQPVLTEEETITPAQDHVLMTRQY